MSAISVAHACRLTELAFMGFLLFVLGNVMRAISVAQARRVAELAFMGFLTQSLLRNLMDATLSGISSFSVAELAHPIALFFMGEISLTQSHEQC